jgi:hypothetical protein
LRLPIILHYLEKRTQEDVAAGLRVSRFTVRRRLEKGIEKLRREFRRQGIFVPGAVLTTFLTTHATLAAPASLAEVVGKLAIAGVAAGTKAATAKVTTIGGISVFKASVISVSAVAALTVGGIALQQALSQKPPAAAAPQTVAPTIPVAAPPPIPPAPRMPRATVRVTVDPRLELLAVVQMLNGEGKRHKGTINDFDMAYRRDAETHFGPSKDHRAVNLVAEMSAAGFCYDAPATAMLHLTTPPDLEVATPFTDYLIARAGGEERLDEFRRALAEFARDTRFMTFYGAHKNTLDQLVASLGGVPWGEGCISALQDYMGMTQASYSMILVPLFAGGYGPRLLRPDGRYDLYAIWGGKRVANGITAPGSPQELSVMAWIAFGFSFGRPDTEDDANDLAREMERTSVLYEPLAAQVKGNTWGNWSDCMNRHLVEAIMLRLAAREFGPDAAAAQLQDSKARSGLYYVEPLCRRLQEYEQHRDKYPTIFDFVPRLLDAFGEIADTNIYSVLSDRQSIVIVVPTKETGDGVNEKIRAAAEAIRDKHFPGRPVLSDNDALNRDLSGNSIVVVGTTAGNAWLSEHANALPLKISGQSVIADKEFTGANLRFITVARNPQNDKKGVVIYTAQRADDIPGIESVPHGATDFVVARDNDIVSAGFYDKPPDWKR